MNSKGRKKLAKLLYLQGELSQQEVCEQLDIDKAQMSRWVNNGGWNMIRAARKTTPIELIKANYVQIQRIHDSADEEQRALTPAESDQIYKLTLANKELDKSADLGAYMIAYQDLCDYIKTFNPAFAKELVDLQMEFIQMKAKIMSNG